MPFKSILLVKPQGRHGLSWAFDIIPTGLEYIAANIEDAVDKVDVIDLEMDARPYYDTFNKYLDSLRPDLVGISMSSTDHMQGLEIAKRARKRGIKTVMGGFHPTAISNELLKNGHTDFVVRGEGEITMRELVLKGSGKGIAGLSYMDDGKIIHNPDRPVVKDLDTLQLPARHLRRYKYYLTLAKGREYDVITTSRGCWGKCSFCCEPSMSHSKQRFRKAEKVLEEIKSIYKFHDKKPLTIEITDPHFMGKPRLVETICDELAKLDMDIEYIAKVRPDTMAKFPKIVRKMVAVGIDSFEMGIESSNPKDLKYTGKGLKSSVHLEAARNIKKWGGSPGGTFVIGLPDHTEEQILQFPEYGKRIGLLSSAFGIVTPYPGTKFYDQIDSEGLIFENSWNRFDEMHSVFKTKHLSAKRLEELASICMAKFWTLETFIERERVRQIRRPQKKTLVGFLRDRLSDLEFGTGSGFQLQERNFKTHVARIVEVSPDPNIKRYTKKVGIHNVINMAPFLKVLGDQTIQMTVRDQGKVLASWIVKTTRDKVEYVSVIPHKRAGCTIDFEVDLAELLTGNYMNPTKIDSLKTIVRLMSTNKGFRKRLNLFRLIFATGAEFVNYLRCKNSRNKNGTALTTDHVGT